MKQKGFSLIEVIVVLAVFSLLIVGIATVAASFLINPKQELAAMDSIDQARMIVAGFANEIRNASPGSDGSFALAKAGSSEIIFYSNLGQGSNSSRIRYYIENNKLYRGIIVPSGTPLSYNLSSEAVTNLVANLANGSQPAFYYYSGTYDGQGIALVQPVNINDVRFIKINLLMPNRTGESAPGNFAVSSGAAVRSLKDNLAN